MKIFYCDLCCLVRLARVIRSSSEHDHPWFTNGASIHFFDTVKSRPTITIFTFCFRTMAVFTGIITECDPGAKSRAVLLVTLHVSSAYVCFDFRVSLPSIKRARKYVRELCVLASNVGPMSTQGD